MSRSSTAPVLFDCDPGIDDAFALAIAHASAKLHIEAVTTTYGNVGLDNTTNNALRVLDWIGSDAPVHAGVQRSLLTKKVDAAGYHGATGLEAPGIPQPSHKPTSGDAVNFLIDHLRTVSEPRTIVATGPLTNLAMVLRLAPDVADKIDQIVFMGGSTDYGNDSPAAEFNMMSDPHAAQIVLESGVRTVMFGLNVTHQVLATPPRIAALNDLANNAGPVFAQMLGFFADIYRDQYGFDGPALHDPCTVAWLIQPELFETELMRVDVDTANGLSYGRSVQSPNCAVALEVDADGFFALLTRLVSQLN